MNFAPRPADNSQECARHAFALMALFDAQTLDLAPQSEGEARAHLLACVSCQELWRAWEQTYAALQTPTPLPPPGLAAYAKLRVRLQSHVRSKSSVFVLSAPAPPAELRDAILRATVGAAASAETPAPQPLIQDTLLDNTLPIATTSGATTPRTARNFGAASRWLTPVLAAWLLLLANRGALTPGSPSAPDSQPRTSRSTPTRVASEPSTAFVAPVLRDTRARLHGKGKTTFSARPAKIAAVTPALRARKPDDAHTSSVAGSSVASARIEQISAFHRTSARRHTRARLRLTRFARATVRSENAPFENLRPHTNANVAPGIQLASYQTGAQRRGSRKREKPARLVRAFARALARTGRGQIWSARSSEPTISASAPALDAAPRLSPRGGILLAALPRAERWRRAATPNLTRTTDEFASEPSHVAAPRMVRRVAWSPDDGFSPASVSDHRPAEVSRVVDDFRAALDEEQ